MFKFRRSDMKCSPLRTGYGRTAVIVFLTLLFLGAMLAGLRYGAVDLTVPELFDALRNRSAGAENQIIRNIRLPRVLLGALVGAGLAVSGAILQGVMHNPLASPGIIGVSAGGGLAGITVLLAWPQFAALLVPAAFAGALLTVILVYLLAWKRGVSPVRLILAGVAVSAMLGAFSGAVLLLHAERVGGVLDFTIGSLSGRSWRQLQLTAPYLCAGLPVAFCYGSKLNVLMLGDEVATGLGMRVERVRLLLLAVAALLAAAAVSAVGLLGFVGLIAPHMVRLALGPDNRLLLPGAALFGAAMVVGCDTVGRLVIEPSELPVGIIMALLGPPFFLFLLRGRAYEA